mmetsp:Transcript_34448/g.55327  ORF Transcript_34448/g.55327 Transcript_34448/m.55327 type:complete len:105 (+) Transcript_34448:136-450(+)
MEAEAILQLEKVRRAAKRRMDEAEERARVQRVKDTATEARTTAMLLDRREKAVAAAAVAVREKEAAAALRQEALDLGPIAVDPAWEIELVELGEKLAALRSQVE